MPVAMDMYRYTDVYWQLPCVEKILLVNKLHVSYTLHFNSLFLGTL